jgi:hypothetical protein
MNLDSLGMTLVVFYWSITEWTMFPVLLTDKSAPLILHLTKNPCRQWLGGGEDSNLKQFYFHLLNPPKPTADSLTWGRASARVGKRG